ncbi:MAG: hydroxyethylthiazole kinase [Syntrophomonadaceae bacterium]|jgi:hydroxyethylthiazole kinase|nr:hydroxyethylthiazole kinase [Syntrophomonadaceae bacterium]
MGKKIIGRKNKVDKENLAAVLERIREEVPLVHSITNYVSVNDCANILLALGASPAMVETFSEAYDFARLASAVYINLGTLTREQETAIMVAGIGARHKNIPLILDPVGCGAIPYKMKIINNLFTTGKIDIIKGNAGEIKTLAGQAAMVKGMDSLEEGAGAEEAAKAVAKAYNCVVASTGKIDVITDGIKAVKINNGSAWFGKITGAGCMAGALCAAAAGVCKDYFLAAVTALACMSIAGEAAAERADAPGSFRVALIDSIYRLDSQDILERVKLDGLVG